MSEASPQSVHDEPTIMWRMQRGDGLMSHAVIGLRPGVVSVAWYVNGRPLGLRDFRDLTSALRWSDQMQAQNWAAGWRLAAE